MAKEMIVSVNGREKKIAILDDGVVTEFYIERGEENSGVVGNIYKGRVQRVLPGMQSAFVDIGLERDAFLYVSDFFDEEEEFERIVMEKTRKADVATAEKVASEKLQQARLEREQAMEALQERIEPLVETKRETPLAEKATKQPEKVFAKTLTVSEPNLADTEAEEDDEGTTGELGISEVPAQAVLQLEPIIEIEDASSLFTVDDSGFERIVDDEETQTEPGETFKEARIQERLTDQVRAIEFEIEPTPNVEVGTLILDVQTGGFERIDDGEEAAGEAQTQSAAVKAREAGEKSAGRSVRSRRGKQKTATSAAAAAKESASANEEAESEETNGESAELAQTDQSTSEGDEESQSSRKKQRGGKRNATKNGEKNSRSSATRQTQTDEADAQESNARQARNSGKNSVESESRANESVESAASDTRSNDSIETLQNVEADTETIAQIESGGSEETSVSDAVTQDYADADASVNDLGAFRSEMAVRRGGRRRRGRGGNNRAGNNGEERTDEASSEDGGEIEVDETEEASAEDAVVATAAVRPETSRGAGRDQRQERGEQRQERGERQERGDRQERGERQERSERGERQERNGRDNRDRRPPTITDLLREGQDVLVQIAKEPIAKKGARITSHIALPGRYIVYMPTIEHIGVSRKIESSHERTRLRNMIQKIRNEEDVPSGGFIVRTAGVGITEQNLRDDARYLVRTWQDIRKGAEKTKSPNLVHQDLDLVERILRDQLSEEFAAIRVDEEAEYLRVVEFINRIQPRMTNRVKLYTREQPIMEAYGVQEEIDKAVKPRVWLKSGGYLVINQTEALVSIDVNTGKFVGKGANRLEDTITKTNMEAVEEIARQIRLRDLGGIIVLDLIDMEDKRNRQKVLQTLQDALQGDKSPTKVLSFNDFGLIVMTRKRVKQSLERTLCAPCHYCQGAGLIKSAQTVAYEILAEARRLAKGFDDGIKQTTLRVHPEIAKALRTTERDVLTEIEDYLGAVDLTSDAAVHQEQFDFAFV